MSCLSTFPPLLSLYCKMNALGAMASPLSLLHVQLRVPDKGTQGEPCYSCGYCSCYQHNFNWCYNRNFLSRRIAPFFWFENCSPAFFVGLADFRSCLPHESNEHATELGRYGKKPLLLGAKSEVALPFFPCSTFGTDVFCVGVQMPCSITSHPVSNGHQQSLRTSGANPTNSGLVPNTSNLFLTRTKHTNASSGIAQI